MIVEHDFFLENGSQLGVFLPRRGLQVNYGTVRKSAILPQPSNQKQLKCFKLTTELSEKVQYSRNQAIKNILNEAILLMSINEALLSR